MEAGPSEAEFSESVRAELATDAESDVQAYEVAMPFWQSYAGLQRYWAKRDRG